MPLYRAQGHSRIGNQLPDQGPSLGGVVPVEIRSALEADFEVAIQAVVGDQVVEVVALQSDDFLHHAADLIRDQVERVLDGTAAEDRSRVDRDLQLLALHQTALAAGLDAGLEDRLVLVVQNQLRTEQLQRALGTQLLVDIEAEGDFPTQVVGRALDCFVVRNGVASLQKQRDAQLRRRHTRSPALLRVEPCEVAVPEQLVPRRRQESVERVSPDVIQVDVVGPEQLALR